MNLMEEIQLLRRVEKLESLAMDHGWIEKPPVPEKEPDAERTPCAVMDTPILMSPLGQQPRWSQAGVDVTHCQKLQHYRINFAGMGFYTVVCGSCGRKLAVDVRWER
jgi:hypothetical protein